MPRTTKPSTEAVHNRRQERIETRTRSEAWKKPPRRIESAECITCDSCVRSCPPEFGAIVDRGLQVVIVPELCSGCPKCVAVCPVDCIYVDEKSEPTGDDLWNLVVSNEHGAR